MKEELQKPVLKTEEQTETTVIFRPVAQNTVIRPMAEAVCIAHGGETVPYMDTADHKEKKVTLDNLRCLMLQSSDGCGQRLDAYQVALKARHSSVRVCVEANDVQVLVSKKTTLEQAMTAFYQGISKQYE
ncbi:MAG: hypothetical protein J6Y03_00080 [Alphaproteobacteria bacterium]|nr:hypothetical protein [Alphaproteobacteria bacterium]